MCALFTVIYLSLIPVLLQTAEVARVLKLPTFLTCGIIGSVLLYLGSLIPGAAGHYTPVFVTASTVFVSLSASILIWKGFGIRPGLTVSKFELSSELSSELRSYPWNIGTVALSIVGLVALSPLADYLKRLPGMFLSPEPELSWDVVSYHLPGLAEFIRNQTLWSSDGPFQSYSQGYELIGGLSLLFFHSSWGLIAANTFSVILLFFATIYAAEMVSRIVLASYKLPVNKFAVYVISLALWLCWFKSDIFAVGKNDVLEAAALLAAFACLLDSLSQKPDRVRHNALLGLAAIAYGLSIAVKLPSLVYLPLFGFMAGVRLPGNDAANIPADSAKTSAAHSTVLFSFPSALATLSASLLLGGFFQFRNLVMFHQLVAPDVVAETYRMALVHQWRHAELYNPFDRGALYAFVCLTTLCFFVYCIKNRSKYANAVPLLCIFSFTALGLGAFAFMPTSVDIAAGSLNFQDRKIIAAYIVAAILIAIFVSARAAYLNCIKIHSLVWISSLAGILLIVPSYNQFLHREPTPGMPGYENVKGLPTTKIYRWVQAFTEPQRIYSAGLRPWGLYGINLQNDVFYDLHSHILEHDGEIRVLAIIRQFHPDLILISVDPHSYTGSPHKPAVVDWLRGQSCFTEVYNDETVSAFKVGHGWEELLRQITVPSKPIRMHG